MSHKGGLPTKVVIKLLTLLPNFDKRRAHQVCTRWRHSMSRKMEAMRKLLFPISEDDITTRNERLSTYQNFYVNYNENTSTATSFSSVRPVIVSSRGRKSFARYSNSIPRKSKISRISREIVRSRPRSSLRYDSDESSTSTISTAETRSYQTPNRISEYPSNSGEANLRRSASENHMYAEVGKSRALKVITSVKPEDQPQESESPHDILTAEKPQASTKRSYQNLGIALSRDQISPRRTPNMNLNMTRNNEKELPQSTRNQILDTKDTNHRTLDHSRYATNLSRGVKFITKDPVAPNIPSHYQRHSSPIISDSTIGDFLASDLIHPPRHSRQSDIEFRHYPSHRSDRSERSERSDRSQHSDSSGYYYNDSHRPHLVRTSALQRYGREFDSQSGPHHHRHHHHYSRGGSYYSDRHHHTNPYSTAQTSHIPKTHHHSHSHAHHHRPSVRAKQNFVTHKLHFHPKPAGIKQSEIDRLLREKRTEVPQEEKSHVTKSITRIRHQRAHRHDRSHTDEDKYKKYLMKKKKTSSKRH